MRIGDLAHGAGVSVQTIRFYERRGLLSSAEREANGYRAYDEDALSRVIFIRSAQAAGLTLSEILGIVALRDAGEAPCEHVATLLTKKLDAVQARQRDLADLEKALQRLIATNAHLDPTDCAASTVCQMIPDKPR